MVNGRKAMEVVLVGRNGKENDVRVCVKWEGDYVTV